MTTPETEFVSILGAAEKADAPAKISSRSLPDSLPVLGLSDIVIFPGAIVPLLVETGPSLKLIDDIVNGDRLFAAVLQRKPEVAEPMPEDLHDVGCVTRLAKMVKFPDGTARVLVEGLWRIKVKNFSPPQPYLRAGYELLRDETEDSIELQAMLRNAHKQFEEITKMSTALPDQVKIAALNTDHPGHFADLIAANLNLSLEDRQKLLETISVRERLQKLLPLLNREQEVLTLSSKIQNDVASSIAKTQRDFFLREQMRVIQRELGESDPSSNEVKSLREKVDQAVLPPEVRKAAEQELDRLQQTPPAAAEYGISRNYLDWILALPWEKSTDDKLDIKGAEKILDEQHFGLKKVKDRLLEFIAVIKRRKEIKGPILCLVGPPGVGKTSLGMSVADALGRKFARIALGGMRDEAEIRGHRRTYVGAMPGRIIQTLRRVESRNPVILLDELDKVGADFRGDPAAALLEVLDPAQNHTFTDHYLDLPFDLSRVLFIATANWLEPIHPALRDRLEVIELPSYTETEKLEIAKRYLVPRQIEEHGLTKSDVKFPDATLRKLIREYTREAGVRQLEREIAALVRKAARKIVSRNGAAVTIKIEAGELENYLGHAPFVSETAEKITEYGIATGLAWTPVGGDILFIEATRMRGRGNLILTGSLGDVMKESAQAAVSYLRSQAKRLDIDMSDYGKFDLHIHVPAGATPKDGPSAGVAIVAALASLLTKRRVKSDVAMTGEISLRGRVLRVGGVKEKVLAAQRFGIKQVILPEGCKADWQDVPAETRAKMKVHFVRQISEMLELALEKKSAVK
ncbi:MAG TPA: endopeptidase La [Verrucomicrobiae bacterium]|nr:endopeptidase La [Verrucomicrobiae bacterium]